MDSGNVVTRRLRPRSLEERLDAAEAAMDELRELVRQLQERASMDVEGSPEG